MRIGLSPRHCHFDHGGAQQLLPKLEPGQQLLHDFVVASPLVFDNFNCLM